MVGKAIDIRLPGVKLDHLRSAAASLKRGGVGFYPSSNFVHVDTGRVRTGSDAARAMRAAVRSRSPSASQCRRNGRDIRAPFLIDIRTRLRPVTANRTRDIL